MQKIKKILSLTGAITLTIVGIFVFSNHAQSDLLDNVTGYAWGADQVSGAVGGVGWISFNCTTGGNCDNSNYGVNVDESTGYITGYAWTPNFGWLKFGNLGPSFPTNGNNTVQDEAKVNLSTGQVTGWARFCAPTATPANCTGTTSNSANGGWDGWVSLSGTDGNAGNPYGVNVNVATGQFSGYAWSGGSDNTGNVNVTGAGWISFSGDGYAVVFEPISEPTVLLQASADHIPTGGTVNLAWNGTGLINSSTGCTASGDWSGQHVSPASSPLPQGGYTTPPLDAGNYTFRIQCLGVDGVSLSNISEVSVTVGININLYAVPSYAYPSDYEVTLHWDTIPANVPPGSLSSCTTSHNGQGSTPLSSINWENVNVAPFPPAGSQAGVYVYENPSPVVFTLTCEDVNGNIVSDTANVTRFPAEDWVDLNNSAVVPGLPGTWSTTLSWQSQYVVADSCDASASAPGTGWEFTGGPETGSQQNVNVPPTGNIDICTTYTITCESEVDGGNVTDSVCLNEFSPAGAQTPRFREE